MAGDTVHMWATEGWEFELCLPCGLVLRGVRQRRVFGVATPMLSVWLTEK